MSIQKPNIPQRSQAVLDEILENMYQLTPTVGSAFLSSVQAFALADQNLPGSGTFDLSVIGPF